MKIYTKTGDKGTTGLFGGPRVSKSDRRIVAYGTVDELNAVIGLVRSHLNEQTCRSIDLAFAEIQGMLLTLGADLATPTDARVEVPRIGQGNIDLLESRIDILESDLPELTRFILPGGTRAASFIHLARTICRRAERLVVSLNEKEAVGEFAIPFLNRLSDYLFVAARWTNQAEGVEDQTWSAE